MPSVTYPVADVAVTCNVYIQQASRATTAPCSMLHFHSGALERPLQKVYVLC